MDDQYRMIEQDIESLLDESHEVVNIVPTNPANAVIRSDDIFLPYKNLEMAAKESPILGQYAKWSTVESDELNVLNHSVEQRNIVFTPPVLPSYQANLTFIEVVKNLLNYNLNILSTQILRNNLTKKGCSFCKKNGMNL